MKITAAVTPGRSKPFNVESIELGEPRNDEVLVRVVATGMCHTDLVVRDQHYPVPLPAVLGHEGGGIVERVGSDVTEVAPGDHVLMSYLSCGTCENCVDGRPFHCINFFAANFGGARLDGSSPLCRCDTGEKIHGAFFAQSSFATHAIATRRNIVKIRKDAPLENLAPLGCGIQTGAGAVMNTLCVRPGASIAVFGAGSVGLAAVMAARVVGATTIIAVDINASRLKLAMELGATHVIDASAKPDAVAEIKALARNGVDYSVETTAHPRVFRQCVDCLKMGGVCGLIGAAPLGQEVSLDMNTILFGRRIVGVMEGSSIPQLFLPKLVDLFMQGRFPIDKLVKLYPLADINEAADDSERGVVVKPVLQMAA